MVAAPNANVLTRTYITNATLVLPDEIIPDGSLVIQDGLIVDICPVSAQGVRQEVDLEADILMPGLIDLHSDAIEHEMEPRPRARLPLPHAVTQGDRKCALAGITTAFHALSFRGDDGSRRDNSLTADLARQIRARERFATVDNYIHCRYEISSPTGMTYIKELLDEGMCSMVSLNDHTPGQGQMRDLTFFRNYLKENYDLPDSEVDRIIREKTSEGDRSEALAAEMAAYTLRAGKPLASHDDENSEQVALRHAQGASISEFPLNFDAAREARARGLHAIVGSPNVMRGGSTGTGARAIELVGAELADCLCSDYAPSTLLPATFQIAREPGWSLHRAARLATANPARAARFADRGEIRPGMRADLIAVRDQDGVPAVRLLWASGGSALRFI